MIEKAIYTEKVYGVSNSYIDSYVSRVDVDQSFVSGMRSGNHIIVYVSSKQVKSSLIDEHILSDERIDINCSPRTQLVDIYKSIIRKLKIEIVESYTKETGKAHYGKVGVKAKLKIPFLAEESAKVESGGSKETSETTSY